jgi:hypothetical protein
MFLTQMLRLDLFDRERAMLFIIVPIFRKPFASLPKAPNASVDRRVRGVPYGNTNKQSNV